MRKTILITDDYQMIGRRVHGRLVAPKHISEEQYAGQVIPETPTPPEPPIGPVEPPIEPPVIPDELALLTDSDGAYLLDSDEAYLMEAA